MNEQKIQEIIEKETTELKEILITCACLIGKEIKEDDFDEIINHFSLNKTVVLRHIDYDYVWHEVETTEELSIKDIVNVISEIQRDTIDSDDFDNATYYVENEKIFRKKKIDVRNIKIYDIY